MSGIQGRLNKQFAITIAISVAISAFNALSLSPALSAMLLRPRHESTGLLARFFGGLQPAVRPGHPRIRGWSGRLVRKTAIRLAILGGFALLAGLIGRRLPTGFIPEEDQGFLLLNVQLPDAASLQRTDHVTDKIERLLAQTPGVRYVTTINGFSLLTRISASYTAFFFVSLEPWDERRGEACRSRGILASVNRTLHQRCPRPSRSLSRRRRYPASARRGASPSGCRTAAAGASSSWPTIFRGSWTPLVSDPSSRT